LINATTAPAALPMNPFQLPDPLIGQMAPPWDVSGWLDGTERRLDDYRGRVLVIEFFYLFCPGCRTFGQPLMKSWHEAYQDEPLLQIVGIHTTWSGHKLDSEKQLRSVMKKRGVPYPVGMDALAQGASTSATMRRWNTGGTPAFAIVDHRGRVRFKHAGGFNDAIVKTVLDQLIEEARTDLVPEAP
jgi:peroxiredoxin